MAFKIFKVESVFSNRTSVLWQQEYLISSQRIMLNFDMTSRLRRNPTRN